MEDILNFNNATGDIMGSGSACELTPAYSDSELAFFRDAKEKTSALLEDARRAEISYSEKLTNCQRKLGFGCRRREGNSLSELKALLSQSHVEAADAQAAYNHATTILNQSVTANAGETREYNDCLATEKERLDREARLAELELLNEKEAIQNERGAIENGIVPNDEKYVAASSLGSNEKDYLLYGAIGVGVLALGFSVFKFIKS